jgi:hypothetical protein
MATPNGIVTAKAAPDNGNSDDMGRRIRIVPPTNGVDDGAAIQAILDAGPGEVVFRGGHTWTVKSTGINGGIAPRSGTRIIIEAGAVLKVQPNAAPAGRLIDVGRDGPVHDVTIEGAGSLLGDLILHQGTDGQWGHLINITNGSSNIRVIGPLQLRQAWGDGIYVGGGAICHDIVVDGVIADDCRREGIAPFWVDGCTVRHCLVQNTGLTMNVMRAGIGVGGPGSGIDCEPNAGEIAKFLTIEYNTIKGTAGCGIYVSADRDQVMDLILRGNKVIDCGRTEEDLTTYQTNGIHVAGIDKPILVDNLVSGSGYDDKPSSTSGQIYLRSVNRPVVQGGQILDGLGRGIFVTRCDSPEIVDVMIQNNRYHAISVFESDHTVVHGIQMLDNVKINSSSIDHLSLQACNRNRVTGNVFRGNRGRSWVSIGNSCKDTLIKDNKGIEPAPREEILDAGTGTVAVAGEAIQVG